jgi:uncharacterized iron-regulated protein
MKNLSTLALLGFCVLVALAATLGPRAPKANIKPHPLCRAVLEYADVDACDIYDTGRLSGRPGLLGGDKAQNLKEALSLQDDIDVLILGEAHDNPHHHRLQAQFLNRGAVVLEQLNTDLRTGLETFAARAASMAPAQRKAAFKSAVGWEKSGWAKYPYDPVIDRLAMAELAIRAGDPPKERIRAAARQGADALTVSERARLKLDKPLGPGQADAALSEIEAAHCGMMPKEALANMAFAQRYRDAYLADATLEASSAHGYAVLLTGNNHARTDRGVPWYIRERSPEKKVVSVMFVEVEQGQNQPETYVPRDPEGKPAADYLILTPRAERSDPCLAFKKQAEAAP